MERLGLLYIMVGLPEPGVRIRALVLTHDETVEHIGLVLPPAATGHITIKLDNGYNVSYPSEAVQEWTELPAYEAPPSGELQAPAEDATLPRVRLIHTGGTIASKVDYALSLIHISEPTRRM